MSIANRIGLLPGFGWIAGHSVLETFFLCLAITLGMMILISFILESRWLPLSSDKQFKSLFPGDLWLSLGATCLLVMARTLPEERRWYTGTKWHFIVLLVAIVIAAASTYREWKEGIFPTRAVFSPTKLYHNVVLYVGFGYVIFTTAVAVVVGAPWRSEPYLWPLAAVALGCFIWWGLFVKEDTFLPRDEATKKAGTAHDASWIPLPVLLFRA